MTERVRFRHVAPAGAPIRVSDVTRAMWGLVAGRDPIVDLRLAIRQRLGVSHCYLTSTGRAGLTIALQALSELDGRKRDEVILPAYTCYSVAASVVKAGLTVRLIDVDPHRLDYDLDALSRADYRRVLAVIATNLYGLPSAMPAITEIARTHDAYVVDDAAQALGAQISGRPSGTWGDVGLVSFDKGKNVSAIEGGALVTGSSAVAAAIERRMQMLTAPGTAQVARHAVKLAAYVVLLRPGLYWIPNAIPQLGLGTTSYTTMFPLEAYPQLFAAVAETMLRRLPQFADARTRNAERLQQLLDGISDLSCPAPYEGSTPAWLRFPVLVDDRASRARVLRALNDSGIGATASYPGPLADIAALRARLATDARATPGARFVAERVITLPIHPLVTSADLARTVRVLSSSLRGRADAPVVAAQELRLP